MVLLGFGYFYFSKRKIEIYDSHYSGNTIEDISNEVRLKQNTFIIQKNGLVSNDPAEFFNGSVKNLKQIKFNFNNVNVLKEGKYKAKAKFKDKEYKFIIVIEDSQNPTLIVENTNFKYLIGPYSTIEEVIEIAGVTAIDIESNDITEDIVG